VIVCGLRGVGLRIIEQLHLTGVPVVVVDDDSDLRLRRIVAGWGVPLLAASARLTETLLEAGLPAAAAVVCVEPDDLRTLEAALLVRHLRADVRLVVQLSNPAVGRALTGATGEGSVLDVAGLAAPSVVEACLRRRVHELPVEGERLVAAELTAAEGGTLRELYGDLAPIAVLAEDDELTVCPGRDHEVRIGDRVTSIGSAADFAAHGLHLGRDPDGRPLVRAGPRAPAVGNRRHPLRSFGRVLWTFVTELDPPLRLALSTLAALITTSTAVLMTWYRKPDGSAMSLLDGLYFTVETIGTIGYGDYSFAEQRPLLRAFAIGLMITGAMLATITFALLTNLLVSRRLEQALGRRNVGAMSGHVIVVGLGTVGIRTVEGLLAADRDVVVIERDPNNRYLTEVRALKVSVMIADATQPDTLRAANLSSAAAVAVLTSDDLINIETGLAVRDQLADRWADVPVVLRLFDRQLGETVERSFGFRHVRSTSALAAPWFVGAALGLDVLGTFYVSHQPYLFARLVVAPEGGLTGLAMQDLSARSRVVAIGRAAGGELEHPPRSGTRLSAGDRAYLVGPYEELLQVLRRDAVPPQRQIDPDRPIAPSPPGN
jgi:Trk K+ transport system NAD-binding subunit